MTRVINSFRRYKLEIGGVSGEEVQLCGTYKIPVKIREFLKIMGCAPAAHRPPPPPPKSDTENIY